MWRRVQPFKHTVTQRDTLAKREVAASYVFEADKDGRRGVLHVELSEARLKLLARHALILRAFYDAGVPGIPFMPELEPASDQMLLQCYPVKAIDLETLRQRHPDGRLSASTAAAILEQGMAILEAIHAQQFALRVVHAGIFRWHSNQLYLVDACFAKRIRGSYDKKRKVALWARLPDDDIVAFCDLIAALQAGVACPPPTSPYQVLYQTLPQVADTPQANGVSVEFLLSLLSLLTLLFWFIYETVSYYSSTPLGNYAPPLYSFTYSNEPINWLLV